MKIYKLTDKDDRTFAGCQWGEGVQHITNGQGMLCSDGWTHWTVSPFLAVLLNPIQGNYDLETAHLWEGEGTVGIDDNGLKVGCSDGRTLRQIPLPIITLEQRLRFSLRCAQKASRWAEWANAARHAEERERSAAFERKKKASSEGINQELINIANESCNQEGKANNIENQEEQEKVERIKKLEEDVRKLSNEVKLQSRKVKKPSRFEKFWNQHILGSNAVILTI